MIRQALVNIVPGVPSALSSIYALSWLFGLAAPDWQLQSVRHALFAKGIDTTHLPDSRVVLPAIFCSSLMLGPCRWVRHPGYLGSLLTWLGAAAASSNLLVFILVLVVLLWAYTRRIVAEEAMLAESLGAAYIQYQQKSWRLVPFLF